MPEFCRLAKPHDLDKGLILIISQNNDYGIRENYNGYKILYTASEGVLPEKRFMSVKDKVDEIWVPSQHCANAITKFVPKNKVFVIPHGVDFNIFNNEKLPIKKRDKFTFLSICRWTWRKSPDLLIEAFRETFKPDEADLLLLSSVSNFPIPPKLPSNVEINPQGMEIHDLAELYRSCHAFVLATKGEGWGLPFTEAGASGLPIIATKWGAQTEFLTDKNSFLVEVDCLIPPPKETDKSQENRFAKPSKEDLKQKLRFVYENYEIAMQKSRLLRKNIERLTWGNTSKAISKRIELIQANNRTQLKARCNA